MKNKEIRFASRPSGLPTADTFQFVETEIPKPQDGDVLVRTQYVSVDPYLRGRMRQARSYVAPFEVGSVIVNSGVGEVVESRSPRFSAGDIVTGMLPWRLYNSVRPEQLRKIDPRLAPVTTALGVLGVTGLTAYFGLLDIGQPKPGEVLVVSGAAGAVGITVCEIAKIKGCKVVGISGTDEKNKYLRDKLGVDAVINYKTENVSDKLKEACPDGIDIYFDNVGGAVSEAVLPLIGDGARIPICGQISMYNLDKPVVGLKPEPFLLIHRATMKGFIVTDYAARFGEAILQLAGWMKEGKLTHVETIAEGFENIPAAFMGLFSGENLGKQIVKVA